MSLTAGLSVGIVVPSANPVVEPELHHRLASGIAGYVTRFPAHRDLDLRQRLAAYVDDLAPVMETLADLGLSASYVACTGSSYPLGIDGDRAWAAVASSAAGHPVITAAGALGELLTDLSASRIRIVSPYPQWLTDQCAAFWAASGRAVVGVHRIEHHGGGGHPIYGLSDALVSAEIDAAVTAASSSAGRADAVMLAGTGVASIEAIDARSTRSDVPVVSANLAGAWWLGRAGGGDGG